MLKLMLDRCQKKKKKGYNGTSIKFFKSKDKTKTVYYYLFWATNKQIILCALSATSHSRRS